MTAILTFILGLALCVVLFVSLSFFISSIWEKEKRASLLSGFQTIVLVVPVVLFFILNAYNYFESEIGFRILVGLLVAGVVAFFLLYSRIGANPKALLGTKGLIIGAVERCDERTIQFANILRIQYLIGKMMSAPPEAGAEPPPNPDDLSRKEMKELMDSVSDDDMNNAGIGPLRIPPDTGKIDGLSAAPLAAMAGASADIPVVFAQPEYFAPPVNPNRTEMSPEMATKRVKGYARNLGAVLVGVTELDPNWLYSIYGCSKVHLNGWGTENTVNHKYAIVFAEEMERELIDAGPHTPCIIESMKNYAKGAFIGVQLAGFLAQMGYETRANHVAHYDGLMVPMAVDAGLGELSRMGYLITKEYGPRVRLSAVTTDLPLIPDKPVDIGVMDFCRICKKCAETCPSRSIPLDDEPTENNGILRWKLDDESCFRYWQKCGTDCGVCMHVCPWSHARTFPHRIIVEAVSRNKIARRLFNWMDDVFYGKEPGPSDPPEWASFKPDFVDRPPTDEEIKLVSGTWKLNMMGPKGPETPLLIIREENGVLTGNMDGESGQPELKDIRVNGTGFSFNCSIKGPMGLMKIDFGGLIAGDQITGNFFSPIGPVQFSGERQ